MPVNINLRLPKPGFLKSGEEKGREAMTSSMLSLESLENQFNPQDPNADIDSFVQSVNQNFEQIKPMLEKLDPGLAALYIDLTDKIKNKALTGRDAYLEQQQHIKSREPLFQSYKAKARAVLPAEQFAEWEANTNAIYQADPDKGLEEAQRFSTNLENTLATKYATAAADDATLETTMKKYKMQLQAQADANIYQDRMKEAPTKESIQREEYEFHQTKYESAVEVHTKAKSALETAQKNLVTALTGDAANETGPIALTWNEKIPELGIKGVDFYGGMKANGGDIEKYLGKTAGDFTPEQKEALTKRYQDEFLTANPYVQTQIEAVHAAREQVARSYTQSKDAAAQTYVYEKIIRNEKVPEQVTYSDLSGRFADLPPEPMNYEYTPRVYSKKEVEIMSNPETNWWGGVQDWITNRMEKGQDPILNEGTEELADKMLLPAELSPQDIDAINAGLTSQNPKNIGNSTEPEDVAGMILSTGNIRERLLDGSLDVSTLVSNLKSVDASTRADVIAEINIQLGL